MSISHAEIDSTEINPAEIEGCLAALISHGPPREIYDDNAFLQISHCLCLLNHKRWSKNPRLYTLLRMLVGSGNTDHPIFEAFSEWRYGDFALPLTTSFLPEVLRQETILGRFWQLQPYVLSPSWSMQEDRFAPHANHDHRNILDGEVYFKTKARIADGGSCMVLAVKYVNGSGMFAMKRILRGGSSIQEWRLRRFHQELTVLRRVQHRHLVSFMGSFTDRKCFALLLSPIADCDLLDLLKRQKSEGEGLPADDVMQLKSFFGCLAAAVLHLHDNGVRHRDLKPRNVLLKAGKVLLCDFGISRDYMESDESTQLFNTPRYCAPEEDAQQEPKQASRNFASDIFSLGCVFLEMSTVIRGFTLEALNKHLEECTKEEDSDRIVLHKLLPQVAAWLNDLETAGPDPGLIPMIRRMMERGPDDRPTAEELLTTLKKFEDGAANTEPQAYIGKCCVGAVSKPIHKDEEADTEPVMPQQPGRNGSIEGSHDALSVRQSDFRNAQRTHLSHQQPVTPTLNGNLAPSAASRRAPSAAGEQEIQPITSSPSKPSSPTLSGTPSRDRAEAILFVGSLSSYNKLSGCETAERTETARELEWSVRVFETLPPQTWKRTRRIEITQPATDNNPSSTTSLWLPLADIMLRSSGNKEVFMGWSDCNQPHHYRAGDHAELEDRVYQRISNNEIRLRFNTSDDAKRFKNCLFSLTDDRPVIRQRIPITISAAQELKIHTVYPTFEIGLTSLSSYRALLALTHGSDGTTCSRLYLAWRELDFEICFPSSDNKGQCQLKIYNLRCPHYLSNIRGRRAPESGLKGVHEETTLTVKQIAIFECPPANEPLPKGIVKALNGITGWSLWYYGRVIVSRKRRSVPDKLERWSHRNLGKAEMMLWHSCHRGRHAQLTIRFKGDDIDRWLTGYLFDTDSISVLGNSMAGVKLCQKTRGPLINIYDMRAASEGQTIKEQTEPDAGDKPKSSSFLLRFRNERDPWCFKNTAHDLFDHHCRANPRIYGRYGDKSEAFKNEWVGMPFSRTRRADL